MKGYITNIEKLALANTNFREILYTDRNCQLVVMSLLKGEEIGEETHDVDQFLRVEEGSGFAMIDGQTDPISDGSVIVVPAGARHNIINSDLETMKLYTLYMPPHHKDGTIHKTKADALADKEEFDGETTENLEK